MDLLSFSSKYDNWIIHPRCAIGEKYRKTFINISGNDGMSSSLLEMGKQHLKSAPKSIYILENKKLKLLLSIQFLKNIIKKEIRYFSKLMFKVLKIKFWKEQNYRLMIFMQLN